MIEGIEITDISVDSCFITERYREHNKILTCWIVVSVGKRYALCQITASGQLDFPYEEASLKSLATKMRDSNYEFRYVEKATIYVMVKGV